MEREETNGTAEEDANGGDTEDTATASERGTPEGFDSLEDSTASLEMEQSETGRRTSIFKFYSYKNAGECRRCLSLRRADNGKPDSRRRDGTFTCTICADDAKSRRARSTRE